MRVVCVIPARMGSTRFPGKPVKKLLGYPLISHVYQRCKLAKAFDQLIVATCDNEIKELAEAEGARVIMTSKDCACATDRVTDVLSRTELGAKDDDLVVMVQGDEVLFTPEMASQLVETYKRTKLPVINLASRLYDERDHDDPNTVKVAATLDGKALYFSRSPIPSRYRASGSVPMYQQTGVIAFSVNFLSIFNELPRTPLETIEGIDMMRVLEHGYSIQFAFTGKQTIGVDTPDDLRKAEKELLVDPVTREYLPDKNFSKIGSRKERSEVDVPSVLDKDGVKFNDLHNVNKGIVNVNEIINLLNNHTSWSKRLINTESNSMTLISQQPGEGNRRHYHPDWNEWWYIIDGQWEWEIEGEEKIVKKGDVVFMPKGKWHKITAVGDRPAIRMAVSREDVVHAYSDET